MLERFNGSPARRRSTGTSVSDTSSTDVTPLRAATAQLLCATGAAAALGHVEFSTEVDTDRNVVPRPLAWAPLVLGPIAAAAQLEYAREPREDTADALRLLDGAVMALGGALFLAELIGNRRLDARGIGALAFASVGVLGYLLERHDEHVERAQRELRRRADLVERFIPQRRPKLDRVVVHV